MDGMTIVPKIGLPRVAKPHLVTSPPIHLRLARIFPILTQLNSGTKIMVNSYINQNEITSNQISSEIKESLTTQPGDFFDSLFRYYSQFLETDFKKSRLPKRRIEHTDSKGRSTGVAIKKFPDFEKFLWTKLSKPHKDLGPINIKRNQYTSSFPATTQSSLKKQIKNMNGQNLRKNVTTIIEEASKNIQADTDPEILRDNLLDAISKTINIELVDPLLDRLERIFSGTSSSPVNAMIEVEDELTNFIIAPLTEHSINEISVLVVEKNPAAMIQVMYSYFSDQMLKNRLNEFFLDYSLEDLFSYLNQIIGTRQILENSDFYLNIGEIHFRNYIFPMFYLPIDITKGVQNTINLTFEPHLYTNKKAIDYILGEIRKHDPTIKHSTIKDRIFYLNDDEPISNQIMLPSAEILNILSVDGQLNLNIPEFQNINSANTQINNRLSFSIFDKSDESIVNDYEALLTGLDGGSDLRQTFEELINAFLLQNPGSIHESIEQDWDELPISDRLVFESPIPLAEEQRKIINAINHPESRFISLEGPPGTGKSHTIAGVVFNQILNGKNILILSDKKEALDVVERFLNRTLEKVRLDQQFQNPILRLGIKSSNYAELLRPATRQTLENQAKVSRRNQERFNQQKSLLGHKLRNQIVKMGQAYKKISLSEIDAVQTTEENLIDQFDSLGNVEEIIENNDQLKMLNEFKVFSDYIRSHRDEFSAIFQEFGTDISHALPLAQRLKHICTNMSRVEDLRIASLFPKLDTNKISALARITTSLTSEHQRNWFAKIISPNDIIQNSTSELLKVFGLQGVNIDDKNSLNLLIRAHSVARDLKFALGHAHQDNFQQAWFLCRIFYTKPFPQTFENAFNNLIKYFNNGTFPLEIDLDEVPYTILEEFDFFDDFFSQLESLKTASSNLREKFNEVPNFDYLQQKTDLEKLHSVEFANEIDRRAVKFYREHRADATTLRRIISKKQKFPTDKFLTLKQAFPCIIANLRDYAEFIPLKKDLFDLVIIDEGSQVSIAQALPAILRTRKMLVLGDREQFSNVKTSTSSREVNNNYMNLIMSDFKKKFINANSSSITRAEQFDIHSSILTFIEMVSNFNTMLRKHFRSYPELISLSSKYFYQNQLQVLKIREKPIQDVIEFRPIDHDGLHDSTRNTNQIEANAIIQEIEALCNSKDNQSVGIITPHTAQQGLINKLVQDHPKSSEFRQKLDLSVFTFDTCQGEERDVILYSMVASEVSDKLNSIFPRTLDNPSDNELDGNLRRQRINVGFSRAKEKIVIFHSKPIQNFNNAIKEALQHYEKILSSANDMPSADSFDPNSPMEQKCYNWIVSTEFFQNKINDIEIHPQFEIAQYLKSLDSNYSHPNYRVDFLISVKFQDSYHKIIVEYDGFAHFREQSKVNSDNWEYYLTDEDVEREKTLESYGYKMIRVNKFNIGNDPISAINEMLNNMFTQITNSNVEIPLIQENNELLEKLQSNVVKECPKCLQFRSIEDFRNDYLRSGFSRNCTHCRPKNSSRRTTTSKSSNGKKQCTKCNEIKPRSSFKDSTTKSGIGRICLDCKNITTSTSNSRQFTNKRSINYSPPKKIRVCVNCGSKMLLRHRRRDNHPFWGCSSWPGCNYTSNQ